MLGAEQELTQPCRIRRIPQDTSGRFTCVAGGDSARNFGISNPESIKGASRADAEQEIQNNGATTPTGWPSKYQTDLL